MRLSARHLRGSAPKNVWRVESGPMGRISSGFRRSSGRITTKTLGETPSRVRAAGSPILSRRSLRSRAPVTSIRRTVGTRGWMVNGRSFLRRRSSRITHQTDSHTCFYWPARSSALCARQAAYDPDRFTRKRFLQTPKPHCPYAVKDRRGDNPMGRRGYVHHGITMPYEAHLSDTAGGILSLLSNEKDVWLCFVDRSPELFTLMIHRLRRRSHLHPHDAHARRRSSPLIFGFLVLALEERL